MKSCVSPGGSHCRCSAQPLSKAMNTDQRQHPNFDRQPLASANERHILDIVRRHGPIPRAWITGHTNLTQQSVHRLIEGLLKRGLLQASAPIKGTRGQPSPTIELVPEAAYSLGVPSTPTPS